MHTFAFVKLHSAWYVDNMCLVTRYKVLDRTMVLMVSVDDVIEVEV